MSDTNISSKSNSSRKKVSAYQQLSEIINSLKTEEISINDAMNKIQLKDSKPSRPYCKVTTTGSLALYGISKQPIVLYADQWNKLLKISRSSYIDNYIKYNESRLKFKNFNKKSHNNENYNENKKDNNENFDLNNLENGSGSEYEDL